MAPHLVRAWSAYKDIRTRSFSHTHTHTHTHIHTNTHAHTGTDTDRVEGRRGEREKLGAERRRGLSEHGRNRWEELSAEEWSDGSNCHK